MPFVFLIEVLAVLCAIWVIYDIWTNSQKELPIKILWTVAALVFSVLAAIIYAATKRR